MIAGSRFIGMGEADGGWARGYRSLKILDDVVVRLGARVLRAGWNGCWRIENEGKIGG